MLRYNVFARILTDLANKIYGIPSISRLGDFGGVVPPEFFPDALETFGSFRNLLNAIRKGEKTESGPIVPFRGLRCEFPSLDNEGHLPARLTGEKATSWPNLAPSVLEAGRIPHQRLGGLIGELGFSKYTSFGSWRALRFARSTTYCTDGFIIPNCPRELY